MENSFDIWGVDQYGAKTPLADLYEAVLKNKQCFWCKGKGHWVNECGNLATLKKYATSPDLKKQFQELMKRVQTQIQINEIHVEGSMRFQREAEVITLIEQQNEDRKVELLEKKGLQLAMSTIVKKEMQ